MKSLQVFSLRHPQAFITRLALALCLAAAHASVQAQSAREHWVGTWGTATVPRPVAQPPAAQQAPASQPVAPPVQFNDQTVRQIVRASLGGLMLRVVVSNSFGTLPLKIGAASVALRKQGSSLAENTSRPLTFGGNAAATVPAGAILVSDPVNLRVTPLAELAVDLYLPGDTATWNSPLTQHVNALVTNYVSQTGNHAGVADFPVAGTTASWFFLSRVEISAPPQMGAVVMLGDSITDGSRSTPNTYNRWADHLARRLNTPAGASKMGVLNMGISGNRVANAANSALARLDKDVLAQPGVTHVFVMEGINDLGQDGAVTAGEVIAGMKQLVERSRARGLKVIASTLTPVEGVSGFFANYYTPETEAKRSAINEWIRTSKTFDGVVDFDRIMRDPARPTQLIPSMSSDDHIHPNDAGYEKMANAIDLSLFGRRGTVARGVKK